MSDLQTIVDVLVNMTLDEMRDTLLVENCHGNRYNACNCPVAVYIEKYFGKPVLVGYDRVCTASNYYVNWQEAYLPTNVINFIVDFDLGVYPELVK